GMIEDGLDRLESIVGHPAPSIRGRPRRGAGEELLNLRQAEADVLRKADDRQPLERRLVIASLTARPRRRRQHTDGFVVPDGGSADAGAASKLSDGHEQLPSCLDFKAA